MVLSRIITVITIIIIIITFSATAGWVTEKALGM